MPKAAVQKTGASPKNVGLLPESYTIETGNSILKQQGVNLRHRDLAAELNSAESIYRQLLKLPALMLYNQSLIDRADAGCDYLQDQIMNIMFAISEVRVKFPEIQKPLSEKRLSVYETIKEELIDDKNTLNKLQLGHAEIKGEILAKLKSQLNDWKTLCRETAEKLTSRIARMGHSLPPEFPEILAKHLECAGTHDIKPEELNRLNLKKNLSYAETALVCALQEIKFE